MKTWILAAVAAAALVLPVSPRLVEHAYAARLYRFVQPPLTTASNAAPFALLDVAIVGAAAAWTAFATHPR